MRCAASHPQAPRSITFSIRWSNGMFFGQSSPARREALPVQRHVSRAERSPIEEHPRPEHLAAPRQQEADRTRLQTEVSYVADASRSFRIILDPLDQ